MNENKMPSSEEFKNLQFSHAKLERELATLRAQIETYRNQHVIDATTRKALQFLFDRDGQVVPTQQIASHLGCSIGDANYHLDILTGRQLIFSAGIPIEFRQAYGDGYCYYINAEGRRFIKSKP